MSLEEAVDLVLFALKNGQAGDIMVQKAPACTIDTLAHAVSDIFAEGQADIHYIGIRHGEKMYETLLTREEYIHAEDMGQFFRVPADNRELNYEQYFEKGKVDVRELKEFNSSNTQILDRDQVKERLLELQYVQGELETAK